MAYIVNETPRGCFHENEKFIIEQDLIGDINLYKDYSNDILYGDICKVLKNDKYLKEKSLFKKVFNFVAKKNFHSKSPQK
jgi:hypothetical protein